MRMLNEIGSYICNQLPSHSLFINGNQLFVGARCTGIYLGILFTLFWLGWKKEYRNNNINFQALMLLILPMAIDGTSQLLGLWDGTNWFRAATGLLSGIGIGYLLPIALLGEEKKGYPNSKGIAAGGVFSVFAFAMLMWAIPLYFDTQAMFLIVNYLTFLGFLSAVAVVLYSAYKLAGNIYKRMG